MSKKSRPHLETSWHDTRDTWCHLFSFTKVVLGLKSTEVAKTFKKAINKKEGINAVAGTSEQSSSGTQHSYSGDCPYLFHWLRIPPRYLLQFVANITQKALIIQMRHTEPHLSLYVEKSISTTRLPGLWSYTSIRLWLANVYKYLSINTNTPTCLMLCIPPMPTHFSTDRGGEGGFCELGE